MTDTWVRPAEPAATTQGVAAPNDAPVGTSVGASAGASVEGMNGADEATVIEHARYVAALQTMHRARCDSLREFLG